ncbi:MAG: N-terminal phage integrase SAM-like domain-containing protein, partial [Anaerolineae bacterium]
MAQRNRNGEGSIGKYGGRWVGRITLPNGKRKAVYGGTFEEARAKLTAVRRDVDLGILPTGDRLTVGAYLTRWLEDSVRRRVRVSTYQAYKSHVNTHLLPAFGRVRLSRLTPMHVEKLMASMQDGGLSATTA